MSYHFGLLLGMLTGMLAGIVLVAILFKKKVLDMHFDERQELARGRRSSTDSLRWWSVCMPTARRNWR